MDPIPSFPDVSPREDRAAQAVRFGQMQAEKERAFQDRLRQERLERDRSDRKGIGSREQSEDRSRARRKTYLKSVREQEKVASAEKEKKDREQKAADIVKKQRAEEEKKMLSYMGNLREIAAMKGAQQSKLLAIKKNEETDVHQASLQRQEKRLAVERAERQAGEQSESDLRARLSLLDTDERTKLYQLQETERMRLRELENEMTHVKTATSGQQPVVSEGIFNAHRNRIATDMAESRQRIASDVRGKREAAKKTAMQRREAAANERLRMHREAEQWYAARLDDIARTYQQQRYKK